MADEQQRPDVPSTSDKLAQERTDMALQRTLIAAERTLMAWIRTSISMIGFGFTIFKFFDYLRQSQGFQGPIRAQAPRNFGMALITLGVLALVLAILEHRQFLKQIGVTQKSSIWSLSMIVALLLVLIGVLALFSVLFRTGPF